MAKKKFRGPEIVQEIDDALNKGLARFLINTQSKLSASSPIDTGRPWPSSWMIGKGVPIAMRPERLGTAWRPACGDRAVRRADHHGLRLVDFQLAALCGSCGV